MATGPPYEDREKHADWTSPPASTFRVLEVRSSARDSGRPRGGGLQAQATRILTAHSHIVTSSHPHPQRQRHSPTVKIKYDTTHHGGREERSERVG
ncbi:hypothetical protein IMZ48_44340 [Candidatus Bathyarchaeota archaeon]|nr:hypothetical protein [Candidatus Bathyarchaeota archaeon]